MKNLLLITASILLFFSGIGYSNAQENFGFVKKFSENLPKYHALVKLASDVDISIVTAISGCHVYMIAEELGIEPIIPNREYSRFAIAFSANSPGLEQLAEYLARGDGIITLDELLDIYPEWISNP